MACKSCEAVARLKDAAAKIAAPSKRGGPMTVTMTFGSRSVVLDGDGLKREAQTIRENCKRGIHISIDDMIAKLAAHRTP